MTVFKRIVIWWLLICREIYVFVWETIIRWMVADLLPVDVNKEIDKLNPTLSESPSVEQNTKPIDQFRREVARCCCDNRHAINLDCSVHGQTARQQARSRREQQLLNGNGSEVRTNIDDFLAVRGFGHGGYGGYGGYWNQWLSDDEDGEGHVHPRQLQSDRRPVRYPQEVHSDIEHKNSAKTETITKKRKQTTRRRKIR